LNAAVASHESPAQLAALVVSRMTLREKLGEMVLRNSGAYENVNAGVPRLCIPSLTLQDGPSGLAYSDTGVTQLPAPLGVAASFDPGLARQYGEVLGGEAVGQGIDVVQGPNLNIDRVPQSGQGFSGFGEDPLLVSALGAREIRGIQSTGAMADAKHFGVYSQETNRGDLDVTVSERALQEIYLAPFQSAVEEAGVATIMCAYPLLNGAFECQDPTLTNNLARWGFNGIVRSDEGAVHDPVAAVQAGTDLLKPASVSSLAARVAKRTLPAAAVDAAVESVLTQMFAHGLIGRLLKGTPGTKVDTVGHTAVARQDAERAVVLLRNRGGALPLNPAKLRSIAVIGSAAYDAPVTAGHGSSHVRAPFTSTPLEAIKARLRPGTVVRYQNGGSTIKALPAIPSADLSPTSGRGHGLTLTIGHFGRSASIVTVVDPVAAASVRTRAVVRHSPGSIKRNPPAEHHPGQGGTTADGPGIAAATTGGSRVDLPRNWGPSTVTWTGTLAVPRSGTYTFSLTGSGASRLALDGRVAVDDQLAHDRGTWSGSIVLTAGHRYHVRLTWVPLDNGDGVNSTMAVGMAYESSAIAAAAAAARAAQVAVVFAADYSGETFDRPTLELPGDQDALIRAVAAANPHTVVVLNTSGPVLMPWLQRVSSVLEAWYPGEEDGAAITAVLVGDVNPSGHLPVTFPASETASAISDTSQWPGTGLVSSYSEGLDVGYRYNLRTGVRPLFPFGFGLSYTRFEVSGLSVTPGSRAVQVSVNVTNTGRRRGGDVVQVYLTYPAAVDEPPGQLAAFRAVTLAAGGTTRVTMSIPRHQLARYQGSEWKVVPGRYTVGVGESSATQPLKESFRYH
jgi:beta-glucosidase